MVRYTAMMDLFLLLQIPSTLTVMANIQADSAPPQ
ncbi:hypothetical protein ABH892_001452 [Paenibacillus sp. RC254]